MNKNEISHEYQKVKNFYNSLGQNLVDALKTFLDDEDIPYLDIYYRLKKFDSFYEKIDRKKYENPFDEIEDICGIRVICYYMSDVEKVNEIIEKEFNIVEQQDKADLLSVKEFAYRSQHYIVSIKDKWLETPNYRKLNGYKAEIQVRTILMHAWAEVEHKLNYKSQAQVPKQFQRTLFRLAAKFEEADEQFEDLRIGIDNYKCELINSLQNNNQFDLEQDFNLNSFDTYIKSYFPNLQLDNSRQESSFDMCFVNNIGFKELENAMGKTFPHFEEISQDLIKGGYDVHLNYEAELCILSLDIVYDDFFKNRGITDLDKGWGSTIKRWRKKLKIQ